MSHLHLVDTCSIRPIRIEPLQWLYSKSKLWSQKIALHVEVCSCNQRVSIHRIYLFLPSEQKVWTEREKDYLQTFAKRWNFGTVQKILQIDLDGLP